MAIKVLGTTVIDDSRNLTNVTSLGFTDATSISTATGVVTAYDKSNVSTDNIGSTILHTLDNPNAYSTSASDQFGRSVAIDGNYAIVSASSEDDAGGTQSGKAYIFNVTTGALLHTLDNPNPFGTSASDYFGFSVAISGNYAIVGAYFEDDAGGTQSGKAYIFNVTTGVLVHTLDNPNLFGTSANDYFGWSVGISGNYAIVGAYFEDDTGGLSSGKAYIFNVTTGALLHTLDNPNAYSTSASDYFGISVAISGNYAIVGAVFEDTVSGGNSGKAYIFNVTTGALIHTLDNPDVLAGDQFGNSVSISGNYAIVGTSLDDNGGGFNSGKAYIFNVTTGVLLHTLINPNAYDTTDYDIFGHSVAISGNYAIVGAYGEDDAGGTSSGKAYIFNVTTGALLHTLDNPNAYGTSASDNFGWSVAIDGNYAIVSAYLEGDAGGTQSGKAYTFAVDDTISISKINQINFVGGGTLDAAHPIFNQAYVGGQLLQTLDNPSGYGEASGDSFGHYVKISGNYAILGVEREDDAGLTYSGKVYIFNATTGKLLHTLDNPSPANFSYFGGEADISGNYAIVSASGSDKVYIYNVTTGALIHTIATVGRSVAISGNYAIIGRVSGPGGEAYIYNVVTGTLVHTLDNPNAYGTGTGDGFGSKVAISGNYCIVGAEDEDDANGTASGKAYIFNVITGVLLHTLDNPNPYGTSKNDQFGSYSLAIDGNYAIVGAYQEDDAGGSASGKAYIFNVATGALLHTLDNPNAYSTSAGDFFGESVGISGNYAIVGARSEGDAGGTYSGKVYIFNVTTGALVHTLDNPNAYGSSAFDQFGISVAISGNYCIVGADLEGDSDGAPSFDASGLAYIFAVDNMTYLDKAIQMVLE